MFPSVVSVACVALVSVLVLVLIFLSCVRTRMPNPVIVAMLGRPFGCLLACLCLMLDARASCRHPLAFLFALHTHPRFSTPLCLRPFCAVACSCSYVLVVVCCCCCAAPACRLPVWLAGVAGCWLKAHTIVSLWLAGASLFLVLCCEPVQTVVFGQSPSWALSWALQTASFVSFFPFPLLCCFFVQSKDHLLHALTAAAFCVLGCCLQGHDLEWNLQEVLVQQRLEARFLLFFCQLGWKWSGWWLHAPPPSPLPKCCAS